MSWGWMMGSLSGRNSYVSSYHLMADSIDHYIAASDRHQIRVDQRVLPGKLAYLSEIELEPISGVLSGTSISPLKNTLMLLTPET